MNHRTKYLSTSTTAVIIFIIIQVKMAWDLNRVKRSVG